VTPRCAFRNRRFLRSRCIVSLAARRPR
jgi:hypothetical protein